MEGWDRPPRPSLPTDEPGWWLASDGKWYPPESAAPPPALMSSEAERPTSIEREWPVAFIGECMLGVGGVIGGWLGGFTSVGVFLLLGAPTYEGLPIAYFLLGVIIGIPLGMWLVHWMRSRAARARAVGHPTGDDEYRAVNERRTGGVWRLLTILVLVLAAIAAVPLLILLVIVAIALLQFAQGR